MRAGFSAAIAATVLVASSAAFAACPPGRARDCVNLDLTPQVSRDIVASERITALPKKPPAVEASGPYTGPTIGINKKVRQAPEIGYRWAIN